MGDLFKPVHFRTPPTSADIWWLLKHAQLMQGGSMHPNGILSSLSQSLCVTLIMHSGCTNEQFSDISCDSFRKMVLEIVIF